MSSANKSLNNRVDTSLKKSSNKSAAVRAVLTSNVAIVLYVVLGAIVLGALVGYYAVVPALKNSCTWFTGNCQKITYRVGGNGTLLVVNPQTNFMYWYDGQYIYSYGDNLPGVCSTKLATGTGTLTPIPGAETIDSPCLKYDSTNTCVLRSLVPKVPSQFDSAVVSHGDTYETVFAINAFNMQLLPQKTVCALKASLVQAMFKDAQEYSVTYKPPPGEFALDIYQVFDRLQRSGVFQPPATDTIWYNKASDPSAPSASDPSAPSASDP